MLLSITFIVVVALTFQAFSWDGVLWDRRVGLLRAQSPSCCKVARVPKSAVPLGRKSVRSVWLASLHEDTSMNIEAFKIVQTGSPIRRHHEQRETLIGLGL